MAMKSNIQLFSTSSSFKNIVSTRKTADKERGEFNMIPNFRTSMRRVSRLLLATIFFVWYSPYVHAIGDRVNQPPVMNRIESYYPLGGELMSLRERLQLASQEITASLNALGAGQSANLYQSIDISFKNLSKIKKLDVEKILRMDATLQNFKARELSGAIIQRQAAHIQNYQNHMTALYSTLEAIADFEGEDAISYIDGISTQVNVRPLEQQGILVENALALLDFPLSRNPQTYSNDLDFIQSSARAIYTNQAEIDGLVSVDAGDYTATDSATNITPAISDKVSELGNDPLTLYNWVYDTVRWLPSYGVMQGADYTLQTSQGNAFDTSSLLISLLRAAGHEARYRYGIVRVPVEGVRNWVGDVKNADAATNLMSQGGIPQVQIDFGGAVEEIEFEHVWVEVKQGADWFALDPSYKQYTYSDGVDLRSAVPFDGQGLLTQLQSSSISNEAEGWVQGVDANLIQNELNSYQAELEAYLNSNSPQATLGDVLGLQSITSSGTTALENAAPNYSIQLSTVVDQLPETLFHKFQFQLGSTFSDLLTGGFGWGSELFTLNDFTANLVGKDIALSFRAASQADEDAIVSFLPEIINGPEDLPDSLPTAAINVVVDLTINGQVVHSSSPMTLGTALKSRLGFEPPQGNLSFNENDVVAGQYQAIGIDMQGISSQQLQALETRMQNTQTAIETDNTVSLTKHDVVGDIMQAGIQGYMAMTYVTDRIAAQSAGVAYYRQPSYGTFSTEVNVAYVFGGRPSEMTFAGVVMDVDRLAKNVEEKKNCYEGWVAFNRASGMRGSAFEHQIPEQLFSTETEQAEGVSTAKALSLAMAQGQRIYTLTNDNIDQLANIAIDDGAREEIQLALSRGFEVTVHQSPITVNGWQGSGYAILDAEYGVGAYKISGGASGGAVGVAGNTLMVAGSLLAIMDTVLALAKLGGYFQPLLGAAIAYTGLLLSLYQLSAGCGLAALPIMFAVIGVTSVSIFLGFQAGGPLGVALALQAGAVILGGLLSKLAAACEGE